MEPGQVDESNTKQELLQALKRARATADEYRAVCENSSDYIMRYDRDYRHIYVNPAVLAVTGFSAEESFGKTHRELGYPDHLCELWEGQFRKVFETGEASTVEFEVEVLSGRVHLELKIHPEHDEAGRIVSLLAVSRDMTARRQAELALRATEERYRLLVEASHELIWQLDREGRFIYVNPACEAALGYLPEEMLGRELVSFVHPSEQKSDREALDALLQGRTLVNHSTVLLSKPGDEVCLSINAVPQLDSEGAVVSVQGTAFDMTERLRANDERRDFERRILHGQKLKSLGVLAGGVAHDFNNLLAGVLGSADLALHALPEDSPARGLLVEILASANRCATLADQMLTYSGEGRFVTEAVDLRRVVEDLRAFLNANVSKATELSIDVPRGLPSLQADAAQLSQVVMNLVLNASEALLDRAGRVEIRAFVANCEADCVCRRDVPGAEDWPVRPEVVLEVRDTGCGMDEATRERIFDPFFTTKVSGRGLGLAVLDRIVRDHGASVEISSAPGEGSCFRVHFHALGEVLEEPCARESSSPWRGTGTILLIDDEPSLRQTGALLLEVLGFDVLTAEDGARGLELFKENLGRIACVMLDLTMPVMDGEATFLAIRQLSADVPVVLSSGFGEVDACRRFAGKRLSAFLKKPYRLDDLGLVLSKVGLAVASTQGT